MCISIEALASYAQILITREEQYVGS